MASIGARGPLLFFLVVLIGVVAWQVVLWTSGGDEAPASVPVALSPPPPPAPPPAPEPVAQMPPRPPGTPADYTLVSGELATLDAADLPADRPVALGLTLPVPSRTSGPLQARIVSGEDRRELALEATVHGDERGSATLEIDPGWLSPGTYLIHLKTAEPSALPLRRYPLQVR